MIKNHFKIAFRSLKNHKFFSVLNILNITVGILVCLIAGNYIYHETSYDRIHDDYANIYRVGRIQRTQDYAVVGFESWNSTTAQDQKKQARAFTSTAGVENYVQFFIENQPQFFHYDNKNFTVEEILSTNTPTDFTEIFTWKLLEGSFEEFDKVENSVLLTKSTAERLHGEANLNQLIGKNIRFNEEDVIVAAIIEDVPANSHFNFNAAIHTYQINYWGAHLYIKKTEAISASAVEDHISSTFFKINPGLAENETFKGHFIQPITDIHLKSNILYELKEPGNSEYLFLIGGFAIIVLFITIFNYTNLTLALKFKKSKSIGVNQVLGASTRQMLTQFFIEGILQAVIAFPLVMILWYALLPEFNAFMGVAMENLLLMNIWNIPLALLVIAIYGVLLSIIPAVMTLQKSTKNLLNTSITSKSFEKISLRKYLMISQIAILIGVSSISVFMFQQMQFINEKDLGFKKDGILFTNTDPEQLEVFQTELRKSSLIQHVGNGSSFAIENFNNVNYKLQGNDEVFSDSNTFYLDFEGIQAYELSTSLTEQQLNPTTRSRKNLINRSAAERFAKILNVNTDEMIGKSIITEPSYRNEDGTMGIPMVIDGIFEDINAFSLKNKVASYFIIISDQVRFGGSSIVAFDSKNTSQVMQEIRSVNEQLGSTMPLEMNLLSDNYAQLHQQDKRMSTLIYFLNLIAILLAAFGIVGTTILLMIGRKREIGIRKLLGASIVQILNISIKEYLIFIGIAAVLSIPISYYVTHLWLESFAYRVSMNPLVFVGIVFSITTLVILMVILSSYRTATDNPVAAIKSE